MSMCCQDKKMRLIAQRQLNHPFFDRQHRLERIRRTQ
jgi:hypothetical protein